MPVNIWELAIKQSRQQQHSAKRQADKTDENGEETRPAEDVSQQPESLRKQGDNEHTHLLIVGNKEAGKTSLVLRFLDQDEAPKPTIALEYTYGRRTRANTKEVVNIWELGGGTFLAGLMHIPVKPANLASLSILLALDLSKPDELWVTSASLTDQLGQHLDTALTALRKQQPALAAQLEKHAWQRCSQDQTEKNLIKPFIVPVVIVGTKYDLFQNFDSEHKKMISKTLRFLAHSHGAGLQFVSHQIESLVSRGRALVSHLAFGTQPSKTLNVDHSKPIAVPAGADSFKDIGFPSSTSSVSASVNSPLELWQAAYCELFPQKDISHQEKDDPAKDPQYKEPKIDQMRAYKDEELARYLRERERQPQRQKAAESDEETSSVAEY